LRSPWIRRINLWFARVVYERDDWDLKLEKGAKDSDLRIGIVLHLARGCIWLSRRILWLLMHAGNAISCFMLRQMEYDADSYEAKIAGSDAFESTALRLRELGLATQQAYETLRQSWAGKRVPNDLPLLIAHHSVSLPADVREKISRTTASGKTSWFDTHPCDADRVRHAHELNQPGVFRLNEPATALFHSFADLCQRVTQHHYENDLELELSQCSFISGEEILAEATADVEAQAAVAEFFGEVHPALKTLFLPGQDCGVSASEGTWREARQTALALRPEAETLSRACIEQQQRRSALIRTGFLLKAGFQIDPTTFGLSAGATSKGEQEAEVRQGLQQTSAAIEEKLRNLEPFMTAVRERVALALQRLLSLSESAPPRATDALPELLRVASRVGSELEGVHQLGSKLGAFALLMDNRANHAEPAQVERLLAELAAEFRAAVGGLQECFSGLWTVSPTGYLYVTWDVDFGHDTFVAVASDGLTGTIKQSDPLLAWLRSSAPGILELFGPTGKTYNIECTEAQMTGAGWTTLTNFHPGNESADLGGPYSARSSKPILSGGDAALDL
jgi:hypothetical protein